MTAARVITATWPTLLPKQRQLLDYEPEPDHAPDAKPTTIEAFLGGYATGKTTGAAGKFAKRCFAAAWSPAYGTGRTQAAAIAPSARILTKVTIPMIESLIPRDLILDKTKSPYPSITLVNGCQIGFVSAESEFEGETLHTIWCDEISHDAYTPERWTNFMMRLRDPYAAVRSMIVSGLPIAGRVRETFDLSQLPPEKRKNRITILGSTRENPHIPKETLDQVMATVASGYEASLIGGQWMMPPNAVFSMFDNALHLTDQQGDRNAPVSVGMDVGQHGAIVFGQHIRVKERDSNGTVKEGTGMLVVDEILTEGESVQSQAILARNRGWNIVPGKSEICIDPSSRRDELLSIRAQFPGVHVVVRDRSDEYYEREHGFRFLQAALRNAFKDVHLQIYRPLATTKHGVVDAIISARRYPNSGAVVKDDSRDHALDALRYLTLAMLRAKPKTPSARPR